MNKENTTELILYTTPDGEIKVDTILQNETIWLTQEKMAGLFGVQRPAITKHLKNIFESNELDEQVVSSILEHTTDDGEDVKEFEEFEKKLLQLKEKKNEAEAGVELIASSFLGVIDDE